MQYHTIRNESSVCRRRLKRSPLYVCNLCVYMCMHTWVSLSLCLLVNVACITYKVLTTGQPTYLSTLLNHYTHLRTLRSANQYRLQHPRVSTEFTKRSFSYLAPKIWNNIPLDIRLCCTLPTFKRHLKTYLFK